jgi:heme A synthase
VTNTPGEYKPSRRDVLRPIEYVGGAAIAAIFTGLVVLITARDLMLALIIAGIAFIVVLVTLALLSMAIKPNAEETAEIDGEEPPAGPTAPPTDH